MSDAEKIAALQAKAKIDSALIIKLETCILEAMKKLEADDMDEAYTILDIAMCGRDE